MQLSLSKCGRRGLSGLPRHCQHRWARVNTSPWSLATATDIRIPGVDGGNIRLIDKLTYVYFDRFLRVLPGDTYLTSPFMEVVHMVEAPSKLFSPSVVMKVLLTRK